MGIVHSIWECRRSSDELACPGIDFSEQGVGKVTRTQAWVTERKRGSDSVRPWMVMGKLYARSLTKWLGISQTPIPASTIANSSSSFNSLGLSVPSPPCTRLLCDRKRWLQIGTSCTRCTAEACPGAYVHTSPSQMYRPLRKASKCQFESPPNGLAPETTRTKNTLAQSCHPIRLCREG